MGGGDFGVGAFENKHLYANLFTILYNPYSDVLFCNGFVQTAFKMHSLVKQAE